MGEGDARGAARGCIWLAVGLILAALLVPVIGEALALRSAFFDWVLSFFK